MCHSAFGHEAVGFDLKETVPRLNATVDVPILVELGSTQLGDFPDVFTKKNT